MAKALTMTVNQLHKQLGQLIDKSEKRTQVYIDKTSFYHPLESDGCCIMKVDGVKVEAVPQVNDDGGLRDDNGRERYKRTCILYGSEGRPALHVLASAEVEDYIKRLEWSDDATEWEKTLVAGNIRGFAMRMRELISGE